MPKISALPPASSLGGPDLFAIVQAGTTKKITASLVLAYITATISLPASSLTGVVALLNGGTAKALIASSGSVVWCDSDSFELTPVGIAGQFLQSNGVTSPTWSVPSFPVLSGPAGSILISDGTNFLASTSLWPNTVGSAGKLLRSNGTSNAYSTSTFADTYLVNTILYASSANTISGLAPALSSVLVTSAASTGVPTWVGPLTNGQIIIGSTGATPVAANLSAGPGVSISNGAGTITIAGTGSGIGWTEVTGTTQAMIADAGYVANNGSLVTLTLPATAAFGTAITVIGKGAGGWSIAQNSGQNIQVGSVSSTVGAGGSVASSNRFDSIELICTTANVTWTIMGGPQGNLTIV